MSTLGKAIKNWGWKGLMVYVKIKTAKGGLITVPGIKNSILLRGKADDAKLFKQLMIYKEYEFNSPIEAHFIIDAGANIGLSSLFFAQKFPAATIVAIEAQKDNYDVLCSNTSGYPNIKCINAGLWSKSTTLEVTDASANSTGFMVRETNEDNPAGFKALSTDDIMSAHGASFIDLYKIDIEGAEKEVLSENVEWLSRTKIIILELHDRKKAGCSQAFFKAFHERNFECHPFGQNLLLINRDLL